MSSNPGSDWIHAIGSPVLILTITGLVLEVNQAFETSLGYSSEDLNGQPLWEFLISDLAVAKFQREFNQLDPARLNQLGIYPWVTQTGESHPAVCWIRQGWQESDPIWICTVVDLKQIETYKTEFDQQEEAKYQQLFNSTPDGMILVDVSTQTIMATNRGAEIILGHQSGHPLVGRHYTEIFPPVEPQATPILDQIRMYGPVVENRLLKRADGSHCWVDLTTSTVCWDQRIVILLIIRDVTERTSTAPEPRVLWEQQQELNYLKSQFITMISHEYRTPLTTILSSTEILESYADRLSEGKSRQHLSRIKTSVNQLTQLVESILLIDQIEANALPRRDSWIDLVSFCQELSTNLPSGQPLNIQLTSTSPQIPICLDVQLLRQILLNLLNNAANYSPATSPIEIRLQSSPEQAIISITDQGIGIPVVDQAHIFERFYRGSNVGTLKGCGLGLAIVRSLVEILAGSIEVASEVGVGSTFTLKFLLKSDPSTSKVDF